MVSPAIPAPTTHTSARDSPRGGCGYCGIETPSYQPGRVVPSGLFMQLSYSTQGARASAETPDRRQLRIAIAVVLLPENFQHQIEEGRESALEFEQMLLTRHPEEIFAAEDETDWNEWIEFFSRTREADDRRKGLVEVEL